MNVKEQIKNWIMIILAIIATILLLKTCNIKHEEKTTERAYLSAIDSLHKQINKKGEEITSTRLILSDYNIIKNKLHTSDSTIKKLQELVDKHTISATIISSSTHDKGNSTSTIIKTEYKIKHDSVYVYPVYKTNWWEKWSKGIIVASKDSISRDVILFNEFDIKQSFERQGSGIAKYFKPRLPMVSVTNKNPYTKTMDLKAFALEPDKKGKRRSFIIGAILGTAITLVIGKTIN